MSEAQEMAVIQRNVAELIAAEYNPRQMTFDQHKSLTDSVRRFGLVDPIIVNRHPERKDIVIGGHQRIKVATELGFEKVPTIEVELDLEKERELNIRLNRNNGEWDWEALANNFDVGVLVEWGFEEKDFAFEIPEPDEKEEGIKLVDKFIVPPFSVLDTRAGYWQERKRVWLNMGIRSELGRDGNLLKFSDTILEPDKEKREGDERRWSGSRPSNPEMISGYYEKIKQGMTKEQIIEEHLASGSAEGYATGGTSIFDPVLSELAYKWFVPDGGSVLDPFAGGSVRGLVAEYLGYTYTGIELRQEQVEENQKQAKEMLLKPKWLQGDSAKLKQIVSDKRDFIFSCPPYYDLEVYSDLEGELSKMETYGEFLEKYRSIVQESVQLLNENRFACFVVGEIRDKGGIYRNFVSDTISAFMDAGMSYYNEIILVLPVGSLSLRINRQFQGYRKVGKTHQNVLVFYKGDVKKIKTDFPELALDYKVEDFDKNEYGERLTLEVISGEVM